MKKLIGRLLLMGVIAFGGGVLLPVDAQADPVSSTSKPYAGSLSCRECHDKFYTLWSTSFHGLAMRPFTSEFAEANLSTQKEEIKVGNSHYRLEFNNTSGWVRERGPDGEKRYDIKQAMGGKNVFYFLTPTERGRFQVLPVAYDVRKKEWFNTTASMIRHFTNVRDEALGWNERPLTFNTACYSCHVSQLSTNYDAKTDTYNTVWAEPGINCETCHGPSKEHNRVCREAFKGTVPSDLKIIRTKTFTVDQHNSSCGPCHAKMQPLTTSFRPGDRYFDHYDLTTLEDQDFSPDGRDLGENYTLTLWRMSPCVKSGKLSCMHCHTSSGRYRFALNETANQACLPCHQKHVQNPTTHTHHSAGSAGSKCISCHMPMTEFARMRRTDHSMVPPAPAATLAFKSPNACNLCHTDRDASWANKKVREWRSRDYQSPILRRARLIEAARKRDWSRLQDMLTYIQSKERDEIYSTSLIRLLGGCESDRKWPAILGALKDRSPLVRSAAASALQFCPDPKAGDALVKAAWDEYRIVRIRAAMALSARPEIRLDEKDQKQVAFASEEYLDSLISRPDDWASHYNMGNYFLARGDLPSALVAFTVASKLEPKSALPLVNISIAYAQLGESERAENSLGNALRVDPDSAEANFNMGLLKAEQKDLQDVERYFRLALKHNPQMAQAAYNLGVLLARDRIDEGTEWCRKAYEFRPGEPRYGYTLVFLKRQKGDVEGAVKTSREVIKRSPGYGPIYLILGDILEKQGRINEALAVYRQALNNHAFSGPDRNQIESKIRALSGQEPPKTRQP